MAHFANSSNKKKAKLVKPGKVAGRRSWLRKAIMGLTIIVAVCVIGMGSVVGYAAFKWSARQRENLGLGGSPSGEPMTVLLVGSDSRADLKGEKQFGNSTSVGGQRADTIMLLHIDPGTKKASAISLPRDLYVTDSATGRKMRINSTFEGGPRQLIDTIEGEFAQDGLKINHYVQVDFKGFRGIVDSVDGVNVYFASPMRDPFSNFRIKTPGCISLDGNAALAYVRSRHLQRYESGRWRSATPGGDLDRINMQQDFIRRMLGKSRKKASNPTTLNALVNTGISNVVVDDELSPGDVKQLAQSFKSLDPNVVEMLGPIPTYATMKSGASVQVLKEPEAAAAMERFLGDDVQGASSNIPVSSVRVRVLNGSGISGQAARANEGLTKAGFTVGESGDADAFNYTKTVIKYATGQKAEAELLRTYVPDVSSMTEDKTISGADVVLITGPDFDGIAAGPGGASTAPSTVTTGPAAPTTLPTAKGAPVGVKCDP